MLVRTDKKTKKQKIKKWLEDDIKDAIRQLS